MKRNYIQEFLSATEGELYVGAKSWCLRNTRFD
jgi:hypothetical protein